MRWCAASATICPARVTKNGLTVTSIASAGSRSSLANCASISSAVPASRTSNFCPSVAVASRASGSWNVRLGSNSPAIVAALGTMSRRRPRRFPDSSVANVLTPVTLPPGRFMLATRPERIESAPERKTIGIGEARICRNCSSVEATMMKTITLTLCCVRSEPPDFHISPISYCLVGTPKGRLTKLEKAQLPWQAVREGVNVKLLPKDAELYVLAKSDARILKERGIRRRKLRWLLAQLKEISKMELQRDDLLMKLGAARAKAPAAWRLVAVEVAPEGATFSYALNRKKLRKVWRREGRYLLRTNLSGRDPAELWQFYIQLVEVEAAFKNLKDDLQLRPIYQQLIDRIEAHIFVSFLAYCLHVTLRARLRPLASGLTPRAVLDKFAAIQMLDVHFPTSDGRSLILSRYTELNADQKLLVKQLNLDLPVQPRPRITAGGQVVQAAAPAL